MTRIALVRVTGDHPAFRELIVLLDEDLRARYPDKHEFFDAFNSVAGIETALLLSDTTGFVACGCFKPFDATSVELKRMFVRADRRGRGFAGEILGGLAAWAKELGHASMVLETGARQPEAIALYEKHGFTRIDRFGPYIDEPESICMRRVLGA